MKWVDRECTGYYTKQMSEQARRVKGKAIPEWAESLYYNKGLFSEALIYHDDEALYFELRGQEDSIVRLSFEMLETLTEVLEEDTRQGRQRRQPAAPDYGVAKD
jgi:hypothetical protein